MNINFFDGNLGKVPTLNYTKDGKAVTNLSVATNSYYGNEQKTAWKRVVVWGLDAENICKYCDTRTKVVVLGEEREREYEGSDGETRKVVETHAIKISFFNPRGKQEEQRNQDLDDGNFPI